MENPIILFDGVCNLCNQSVQTIIALDKKDCFRFASLQSNIATNLLKNSTIDPSQLDSVILVENEKVYTKSDAVIHILKYIPTYSFLRFPIQIVPKWIRDKGYDLIAQNRYRWFGKKESCWLPTPELKAKFLQ